MSKLDFFSRSTNMGRDVNEAGQTYPESVPTRRLSHDKHLLQQRERGA